MDEENHMVLPFADDGAISVDYCEQHEIEFESYCPDCYLAERRREIANEVNSGIVETALSLKGLVGEKE